MRAVAPLAVVQTLAGIALGPSLLGRLAPELHAALFTPTVLAAVNGLSAIGVLLFVFVFVSGMHLDIGALRRDGRGLPALAFGGFELPLAPGAGLGVWVAWEVPGALGPRGGLPVFLLAAAATILGKVAGIALPARRAGESWSFAFALGVMMQTKGLMEVVVLTVLHQARLIGSTVFSALIAMAVLCTVIPGALTRALARRAAAQSPLPANSGASAAS